MKLTEALPEFVAVLEGALLHLGRGDLVVQLKSAVLQRWTYDDFADTTYLVLSPAESTDRLSLYDEAGANIDTDDHGRVCGIEILEGRAIADRLGKAGAQA